LEFPPQATLLSQIVDKLPTNYIMGSSDVDNHDTDIDAILVDTGTTLENRLIAIENDTDVIDDGTSGLVKIASDVAAVLVDTDEIQGKLPTNYLMGSSTQDDQDTIILAGQVPDNTSTADSIKLAPAASGVNDIYNENLVVLVGGTGAGQARMIADYIGATETAVLRNAWLTTPDNTSLYRIYPFSGILLSNTGLAVAATADTITLNTSAQAVADVYVGHTIFISGGTGLGQARLITAYTAGRVATVTPAWDVTPGAAASVYLILPVGRTYVDTLSTSAIDAIVDSTWDEATADHTTETSFGGELGTLDPNVTLILADTAELQTDHADGGRLDLIWDAIKAITDRLLVQPPTTVATSDSTTSFTLTAGPAIADAFNGHIIMIQDADDSHYELRWIEDWTAARVVTVEKAFGFTPAVGDDVWIMATSYGGWLNEIWNERTSDPITYDYRSSAGAASPRLNVEGDDP
jgi:hypothetical protein